MTLPQLVRSTGVSAHRGLRLRAAENSWQSFVHLVTATKAGCSVAVEFDIRCTLDGALIVVHDDIFEGRFIGHLTYAELQMMSGDACPPLLEDVVPLFVGAGIPQINPELKEFRGIDRALAILDPLRGENVLVSSFQTDVVEYLVENATHFDNGLLLDPEEEVDPTVAGRLVEFDRLGADALITDTSQVSKALADEVHARGKRFATYTLNDPSTMRQWANSGDLDWIITDVPQVLLPELHGVDLNPRAAAAAS